MATKKKVVSMADKSRLASKQGARRVAQKRSEEIKSKQKQNAAIARQGRKEAPEFFRTVCLRQIKQAEKSGECAVDVLVGSADGRGVSLGVFEGARAEAVMDICKKNGYTVTFWDQYSPRMGSDHPEGNTTHFYIEIKWQG